MSAETGSSGVSVSGETSGVSSMTAGESHTGVSSAAVIETPYATGLELSTTGAISGLSGPLGMGHSDLDNQPKINNPTSGLYENPFALPEYKMDPQTISLDTTQRFPELAFNSDLYESVIEDLTNEVPPSPEEARVIESSIENVQSELSVKSDQPPIDIPLPPSAAQKTEAPSLAAGIADIAKEITYVPKSEETIFPATTLETHLTPEETADESALLEALEGLHALNLPEEEEYEWVEKLQRATEDANPQPEPAPSLAYELTFGEVESFTVENEPTPQVGEEILRNVDEAESAPAELEEKVETAEDDPNKKIIKIPEDPWDRYEITERNQTAEDVQKRRKEFAQEAVYSAINTDGEFDTNLLGEKLAQLDDQTAEEKLRITEGTLQIPDVSGQIKAAVTQSQTSEQAINEVVKVIDTNEAIDHLHETASHQTLRFEDLDQGAQDVITSQKVEKVIRPLVWEAVDKLPLKNPVEIERSKKAA